MLKKIYPNNFCILPWMHLATNSSGNYRVCCNSTPGKNFILKHDGTPYKVYKDDIKEVWNSETYQKIRKQFLNNERPEMCERCFREEDSGLRSARNAWNEQWMFEYQKTVSPDLNITYVDLRLGNLCNLKCIMCNPYASNQWVKDWELIENWNDPNEKIRLSKMDWPNDPSTWKNLIPILNTVKMIYLTGGEPTLAVEQYKLFDICIDKGLAKNITLKYNSNLTNIPRKMIEYWKHFKKIKMNASIDGIGKINDYIRYPSNWKNIEKQLKSFIDMNVSLQVHTTVQIHNIMHLPEIFNYFDQYNIDPYLNILNHPDYLNVRVLPYEQKLKVKKILEPYIHKPKVEGLLKYIDEDWSHLYDKFIEKTKILDEIRKVR
tara:strand:- start:7396 stop:8523 length:1128 start_codon:yes stop_codon:yes gene_type:complete